MTKSVIFGSMTALLLASAALNAAPGSGKMAVDSDGNGAVSKTEAMARADAMFAKMDANNDGTLNMADRAAKMKERFAKMDTDNSGTLSEAEFMAASGARTEKRAQRREMRSNRVSSRGNAGGMRRMKMADANNDQAISQSEFRAAAEVRFAKADSNNDGAISADERKAQRKGKWGQRRAMPTPDAS